MDSFRKKLGNKIKNSRKACQLSTSNCYKKKIGKKLKNHFTFIFGLDATERFVGVKVAWLEIYRNIFQRRIRFFVKLCIDFLKNHRLCSGLQFISYILFLCIEVFLCSLNLG